jgi:hypothetical protein
MRRPFHGTAHCYSLKGVQFHPMEFTFQPMEHTFRMMEFTFHLVERKNSREKRMFSIVQGMWISSRWHFGH